MVMIKTVDGEAVEMSPEEEAEFQAIFDAGAKPIPVTSVSAAQAKIALYKMGYLDRVKQMVAAYGVEAQIWFDSANTWERNNPYNQGISLELGLTPEQEDSLWQLASVQ